MQWALGRRLEAYDRTLDMHISNLRKKLGNDDPPRIETMRGLGYSYRVPVVKRRFMVPLFWRIFLLIWLAMAVTVVVSNLASRVLLDRERAAIERQFFQLTRDLGFEVAAIRESQGRRGAQIPQCPGGRTGPASDDDQRGWRASVCPRLFVHESSLGGYRQKPAIVDVGDGCRFHCLAENAWRGLAGTRVFRFMEMGLAFVLITLACWLIARFVSRPMRHMEATAQAIAGGKTQLRVDEQIATRRDEVGQLATAFNAMTDQLCKLLERQKHLLRDISHDLRTPLARQRVAIEFASEGDVEEELMTNILRQNERLEVMTGQDTDLISDYRARR